MYVKTIFHIRSYFHIRFTYGELFSKLFHEHACVCDIEFGQQMQHSNLVGRSLWMWNGRENPIIWNTCLILTIYAKRKYNAFPFQYTSVMESKPTRYRLRSWLRRCAAPSCFKPICTTKLRKPQVCWSREKRLKIEEWVWTPRFINSLGGPVCGHDREYA